MSQKQISKILPNHLICDAQGAVLCYAQEKFDLPELIFNKDT